MRAITSISIFAAYLSLSSCDNPGSKAKAPGELRPRDVIVGTWVAKRDEGSKEPYIATFEFGPDHSAKLMCSNAKEPIKGKYQFTNDYTLKIDYEATDEARRTFADLPASETFTINVRPVSTAGVGGNAPATLGIELILTNEKNFSLVFRKQ